MSTLQHPRPLHPFPHLVPADAVLERSESPVADGALSQAQRQVITRLRQGGRVLFDMEAGRALVYSARQGLRQWLELSVRALAHLVRQGWLVMVGREGRLVHYALAGRQAGVAALR